MGKSKHRNKQKMDPRKVGDKPSAPKKEKDWSFEDVLRSKTRRR